MHFILFYFLTTSNNILFFYLLFFSIFLLLKWIYYICSCIMIITIWFHRISIPQPRHISPPPKLSPPETISFSMSVSQYLFCKVHSVLFFQIPHVSESIWCWYPIGWLTSLSMIISRSIHVAKNASISFLSNILSNFWIIFHWIYIPRPLYPLLCWWTFRLFSCLAFCK